MSTFVRHPKVLNATIEEQLKVTMEEQLKAFKVKLMKEEKRED